jgi:hypothetical protein
MFFGHLIEEFDDVGKVHVAVNNDVTVVFHHGKGDKKEKMTRDKELGCPNGFPD